MWPSLHLAEFLGTPNESGNESIDFGLASPLHHKASILAKSLLGPDMEFDFDMLITKEGRTETETPWHCDEAYWLKEMPDKRELKVLPVYLVYEVPMVLKDQKVVMVPSVSQVQSVQWEKREISAHLVFPDTMDREV